MNAYDLFKLIPDIYHNIYEYNAVFSVVASAINKFLNKLKQQKSDLYIYSDDISETGVDRLAKSMKIDVSGLTFEDKVFKIKSVLLDKRPYNIPNVKNMLDSLCGADGYVFNLDKERCIVTVKIDLGRKNQFAAVYELLDKVVPSNMNLFVDLLYNLHGDMIDKTYGELSSMTHEQIRSDVF